MRYAAALFSALLYAAFSAPAGHSEVAQRITAELRLRALTRAGDQQGIQTLYADPKAPPTTRGEALLALFDGRRAPLVPEDRVRLLKALADPAPPVRAAALRIAGQLGEKTLEGEALRRAAEDRDPGVRVEALKAVRSWSRQGHLYFLQEALGSSSPQVQVEALNSLAALPLREVSPEVLGSVDAATSPFQPPGVRLAALGVLRAWGRLDWSQLREVLLEGEAQEALRLFAIVASDLVGSPGDRNAILLDILGGDPSERVAWEAFERVRRSNVEEPALPSRVVSFLAFNGRRNAAAEGMASYLRTRGYRIEFRAGAWKASRP